MSQFHIDEIVFQDDAGVTYLAHDVNKGYAVSLRRFFPFRENHGGLSVRDTNFYTALLDKLAWVSHDSLRPVMSGGVDSIDHIPYIVTPWYPGSPLNNSLANHSLSARQIVNLLRSAFEISILTSNILQEEGIWVEANPKQMILGENGDINQITYCLSPHKLLRIYPELKRATSLLPLVEFLADPKLRKHKSKIAKGLIAWVKWQTKNPHANLEASFRYLSEQTKTPQPAAELFNYPAVMNQISSSSNKLSATNIVIGVFGVACATMIGFLLFGDSNTKDQNPSAIPIVKTEPRQKQNLSTSDTSATIFTLLDTDRIKQLDDKTQMIFCGTLDQVATSSTGASIFLYFTPSFSKKNHIRGVIRKRNFQDEFSEEVFDSYLGKKLQITCRVTKDYLHKTYQFSFTSLSDIEEIRN